MRRCAPRALNNSVYMTGARLRDGSSSRTNVRGRHRARARPPPSACAPLAYYLLQPLPQTRQEFRTMSSVAASLRRARAGKAPSRRFSRTVSWPRSAYLRGTSVRPRLDDALRTGLAASLAAVHRHARAAGSRKQAGDHLEQRGLSPVPLAPRITTISPRPTSATRHQRRRCSPYKAEMSRTSSIGLSR